MGMMMSFGWASIMILIGMVARAKIRFLGNILMPASVIAGIVGFIFMNFKLLPEATPDMYTQMVGYLFTISFISIGLTGAPESEEPDAHSSVGKEILKGSMAMGFVWDILYCLQPIYGFFFIALIGGAFGMNALYGLQLPFAFCQGPGQSATFGTIIEQNGWPDAIQVGVTYAAIGFLIAFLVGVPMAKYGLKKGLTAHSDTLSEEIIKGLYPLEKQEERYGRITTYSGNIDVMAFHVALVGLCFIGAIYLGKVMKMVIPGVIGTTFSSMTFLNGMIVAYVVRFIIKKLNLEQYHDSALQTRITGFSTDLLITCAFMSISLNVVGKWLVPIFLLCLTAAVFTCVLAIYFGQRIGGNCDFERTLGLWGSVTGTCPTGIALIRIVDPNLKTTAPTEMGAMNIFMLPTYIIVGSIIAYTANPVLAAFKVFMVTTLISLVAYLIAMKVFRLWGKSTYSFLKGKKYGSRRPASQDGE